MKQTYTTIHTLFAMHAEQTPEALAIICEGQSLTYSELNRQSSQVAYYLQAMGIGQEARVGLCVGRTSEMIVDMLGILKAGASYVPLDPQYPSTRLEMISRNAGLAAVLTTMEQQAVCSHFISSQCLLDIQTISRAEVIAENEVLPSPGRSTDLAYILYTSGSTGVPKGVMVEHGNVLALLQAFEQVAPSGEDLVGISVCPFSFDVSVWEIFSVLCYGGTLHLLTPETIADARHFAHYLIAHHITSAYIPPALLLDVASEFEQFEGVIALNRLLVGVEPIKQGTLQRFRNRLSLLHIINGYGPTETTICATFFCFQEAREPERRTPIGTAIAGYEVYLLDGNLDLVPVGVAGEIYIGGKGLSRGYLKQPDASAERFIPDPFSKKPGTRLYKTGDLARYLPDGAIEYLDRIDNQVKIRGFRIEVGEIESILSRHASIRDATIIAHEDTQQEKYLTAYFTLRQGCTVTSKELRCYLQDYLPEYMLPSTFVLLDRLPLTPNGKVDRRALPAPARKSAERDLTYVRPRTPLEEILAHIWSSLLGSQRIGVYDNFFEEGGNSLVAARVVARIRDVLKVELPLRSLFEAPVIVDLALLIEGRQQEQQSQYPVPLQSDAHNGDVELSPVQQELWFLEQLVPDTSVYTIAWAARLTGPLHVNTLRESLHTLYQRHHALRTTFCIVDGQPVQHSTQTPFILEMCDLRTTDPAEREAALAALLAQQVHRPFSLEHGPLFRALLFQLEQNEAVLLLTMHHIISDGWSLGVLLRELSILYNAYVQKQAITLPPLLFQYADYVAWQRHRVQGEHLEHLCSIWRTLLDGAPHLVALPTDRPRATTQTFRGAWQPFKIPSELAEALEVLSRQEGCTLFMTILTAFETLIYRYSNQNDFLLGTSVANRWLIQTEPLVGFFVNTLVLRARLSSGLTMRQFLRQTRERTLEAYTYQDLPFTRLVEELQPDRNLSYSPLIQIMLVLQNTPVEQLQLDGVSIQAFDLPRATTPFDIVCEFTEMPDGTLHGKLSYNTDLFEVSTITRFIRHFQYLLTNMVADPDQLVEQISLLSEEEQQQILFGWNQTTLAMPQNLCLHQLFEAQVERTPEAVAVVYEDQSLTYAELNRHANRLAHYLRQSGVGPEVLAAVYVERSPDLVVALLGILKAGGAYVPLDRIYPAERLAFMLDDSQATVLVTQGHLVADLPVDGRHIVCLDTDAAVLLQQSVENPETESTPSNLAYVIYTSGSTGYPKGVQVLQHAVVNLLTSMSLRPGLTAEDTLLAITTLSFDIAVLELFLPLLLGARVVIASRNDVTNGEALLEALERYQVTVMQATPVTWRLLLATNWQGSSLMKILCTGEALPLDLALQLLPKTAALWNMYGPTETTVFSSICKIEPETGVISIGRPIANTQMYVLDNNLQPLPVGVVGNLYIAGHGLARGYLHRPELTAVRFIPPPFSSEYGARIYKTGDLARYQLDGMIEVIGRADYQVKIRGFRIEPGEIEEIVRRHAAVQDVVVHVREDIPGEKRLIAYIVMHADKTLNIHELRQVMRKYLPDYMIPATVVTLAEFPLLPNGKVNRHALPAPGQEQLLHEVSAASPRTSTEMAVAEIWSGALGVERIHIDDNFFALGGHSLLISLVAARLRETFQIDLPLRVFFDAPTLATIAEAIDRAKETAMNIQVPAIKPVSRNAHLRRVTRLVKR